MEIAKTIFFTGGARSGKSRLAQEHATRFERVVYVATAEKLDKEMEERVAKHQASRPANWTTIEEPLDLCVAAELAKKTNPDVILLDCLTLWLSNHFLRQWDKGWDDSAEEKVLNRLRHGVESLKGSCRREVIIVSNEVGCGIVPETHLVRSFRDLSGRANQVVAGSSDKVFLVAAGLLLQLKPPLNASC